VIALAGCATKPTRLAYDCPRIELPPDPITTVTALNDESGADEIIKAWVATAYAYRGWNLVVRKQVENSK
jgi:hypothetical protein